MRASPSARITAVTAQEMGQGPNSNHVTSGGLANLVSGDGNIAERVNAAQGQIQKYLGLVNKNKNQMAGNGGSRASLHLRADGMPQKGVRHLGSMSATNKNSHALKLQTMDGNIGGDPTAQANFLSGVKRTNFAMLSGKDVPGPGTYID